MRNRAFGVEIECGVDHYGDPPDHECEEWDDELGEMVQVEVEHCVACCGCWQDDEDGGPEFARKLLWENGYRDWADQNIHNDGSGVEIPSPILEGRRGLDELGEVMALLRRNGFYTTPEDGLHVHHDAPEFVENDTLIAHLVELWEENLPVIDRMVAPNRRGGDYWACNSYATRHPSMWESFKQNKSLDNLSLDKFRSLNVTSLYEHGTVEFRLHEGTLDFNEAASWVMFGQEFLELAKRKREVVTCASVIDLLRVTRTSPKSTRRLVEKASRKEHAYA